MIIGIGCDIIKIKRIEQLIKDFGDKFLHKIFTPSEIKIGLALNESKKTSFFAKRFAAKEAIAKALGTGIGEKLNFTEIEIISDASKRPLAFLKSVDYQHLTVKISIADEDDVAIAFAIIEDCK